MALTVFSYDPYGLNEGDIFHRFHLVVQAELLAFKARLRDLQK